MNNIKTIVNSWFESGLEARCKQLYPGCTECPFWKVSPYSGAILCGEIWGLLEGASVKHPETGAKEGKNGYEKINKID
jgi:hypothetical protein